MKLKKEIVIHTLSYLLYRRNKQTLERKYKEEDVGFVHVISIPYVCIFFPLNFPVSVLYLHTFFY